MTILVGFLGDRVLEVSDVVELCSLFSGTIGGAGSKVDHLGEVVNED